MSVDQSKNDNEIKKSKVARGTHSVIQVNDRRCDKVKALPRERYITRLVHLRSIFSSDISRALRRAPLAHGGIGYFFSRVFRSRRRHDAGRPQMHLIAHPRSVRQMCEAHHKRRTARSRNG